MPTPQENAADKIGRAIDGQIFKLTEERKELAKAETRIQEIDAELAELQAEKARIEPRRPKKEPPPSVDTKDEKAAVESPRTEVSP